MSNTVKFKTEHTATKVMEAIKYLQVYDLLITSSYNDVAITQASPGKDIKK